MGEIQVVNGPEAPSVVQVKFESIRLMDEQF